MTNQKTTNMISTLSTGVSIAHENSTATNVAAEVFADFISGFDCTNKTHFDRILQQLVMSFSRHPKVKCCFLPHRYKSLERPDICRNNRPPRIGAGFMRLENSRGLS